MSEYLSLFQTRYGKLVSPVSRLMLFSPSEWEIFTEEWLDTKKSQYFKIERFGGAGDKGRDVVGYFTNITSGNYIWDCYQCKHYDHAITPTEIYKEIGKILYYTFEKHYPIPRAYYFVSPKGCGSTLSDLLDDPNKLKAAVVQNWNMYCKTKITSTTEIDLIGSFLDYVQKFDYKIFGKILPKNIVEEHKKHSNHIATFGGGLPPRPILDTSTIPSTIPHEENVYVSQLLLAYGSDCLEKFSNFEDLPVGSSYQRHFNKSRISFHYAEQLRNFSRDNLPPGVFEDFQDQLFDGIENLLYKKYTTGFEKVNSVEVHAPTISINNPLWDSSYVKDRKGVCHQLVNDGKITWMDK